MQTIKTLIVDDEARIRRGIERLVNSCGDEFEVVATASDGMEALDCFRAAHGTIDLLITDVKMPEMDGLTLIKEAKKTYSFYPLLISGYDDFAYLQTALREGALDYLLKPVDREQFRQRMSEIGTIINNERYQNQRRGEMERGESKLAHTRQVQTLSYITSMDMDMTTLGYWVDEFPKGSYLLFHIRMDTLPVKTRAFKANDWKAYFYALENMMSEVLDNHFAYSGRRGWCWRGVESDFWMLLHNPDRDVDFDFDWETAAYELSVQIRSAVQKHTPFTVTVAYGDVIEDLYLLPAAKRQAVSLMNYRFIYGGNQTFRLSREKESLPDSGSKELPTVVQKLKRSVEQGNSEEAAEHTKQFFELLDRVESPAIMQTAVQNALILLHSAGLENRRSLSSEATSIEDELQRVGRATNLHELKQCVKTKADRIIEDVLHSRESGRGNLKPVESAKMWIKEHLEQEITIKKIADHVFMNPTYFSEVFKMQTGETVLDYLTRHRMDRAKELLEDSGLKLQEVCSRVGYQDVKYFSRLFKQWTGQTPSKYRENVYGERDGANGNKQ